MAAIVAAGLWAALVTWLILRATRQFRAYAVLPPAAGDPGADLPLLTVVVPARDEADVIGRCLAGLAAQDYPAHRMRVVVVDDGSSDATPAIVAGFAARDPRFRMARGGPLPAGWTGKSHACWRGARLAEGDWLCFVDADTAPRPELLRSALAEARRRGVDLLSLEPTQELVSVWERLVIPAGLLVLAVARDLRRSNDPATGEAAANGQFLLMRRDVYEAIGGHAAVCGAIAEDSALAGRFKAQGFRYALLGAGPLVTVRMYRGLRQLWQGLAKNCIETLGGVGATAALAFAGFAFAWASLVLPAWSWAVALSGGVPLGWAAAIAATLASLAVLALNLATARHLAVPPGYGALFPLGYSLAAALAVTSLAQRATGRIRWKGRVYLAPAGDRRSPPSDGSAHGTGGASAGSSSTSST